MAPIDRREHRQQRVRGAGPSSVQASFGFNFGALGAQPAKQSSLPPQRSSRRTPVRSTPQRANGSAQRHRSASVQRSGGGKRKSTPKDQTVTPQIGKRKRGSPSALPSVDDGDEDELSPDRQENVPSIEKSRRVVGTVSPIREETDDAPDELSILEDGGSTARKTTLDASAMLNGTPASVLAQKRVFSGNTLSRTPIADRIGSMKVTSQQTLTPKSRPTEPGPATPGVQPNGPPRVSSASRFGPQFDTPVVDQAADESEDELSPPQVNGSTPRVVATEQVSELSQRDDTQLGADELSSPMQPTPVQETPVAKKVARGQETPAVLSVDKAVAAESKKRGRPRRIVLDEENETSAAPEPAKTVKRGRPAKKTTAEEPKITSTPAVGRKSKDADVEISEDDQADELSPDKERPTASTKRLAKRGRNITESADAGESDEHEEIEQQPEEAELTPRPASKRKSPMQQQHIKPTREDPPRKRHKFLGPKHAISVMRIKGSTVRGITVADTTRTILEETINHRLKRMAEKMQASKTPAQRKELRSEINMALSFQESLNEKLLDLQDANDVLSTNFKKLKLFKRDNAELRKDILALQNNRQEIALDHDDIQAEYAAEKAKVDARNRLSENMFELEAAIENGRQKAHKEGRDHEGPQVPLSMLLGMVGSDVGSFGGGLLSNIKTFNGALERAAGWLEGRA